jgi:hypothetical protein
MDRLPIPLNDITNSIQTSPTNAGLARRGLLGATGLALGSSLAPPGKTPVASAAAQPPQATNAEPLARPMDAAFRRRALEVRQACARADEERQVAPHPTNGDEERYASRIGSDTRGLPHNQRGEVDPAAWRLAAAAYASGDPADFEKIPLGGPRRQINPLGTLAVSLSGINATRIGIPPAPALASAERASEAVEVYWQSLLRDVPLAEFRDGTDNRDVLAAVEEIGRLSDFRGPKAEGRVTPGTLFRGTALYSDPGDPSGRTGRVVTPPGILDGPIVSQFLLRDVPYGARWIGARIRTMTPTSEFLTDPEEWLRIQNGEAPRRRAEYDPMPRYIATGRDLAAYVAPGRVSLMEAALLLAIPTSAQDSHFGGLYPLAQPALSSSNPYRRSRTQTGAGPSFGVPHMLAMLAEGSVYTDRACYWQKWFVHRTLRPEAYGGLAHQCLAHGVSDYPLHDEFLRSEALGRSKAKHGSHLLSQVYPDAAPMHSSYPGGASSVGAVGVTLLKAFFDESRVVADPVQPDPRDPARLVPYAGAPLTIGGELNKLALNFGGGRNWSGIHWRSDAAASMALGEEVAINLLRDMRMSVRETFDGFSFTRFDGSRITV